MAPLGTLAIKIPMQQRIQWVFRPRAAAFSRRQLVDAVAAACKMLGPDLAPRLKLTATLEGPPRWSVIPFSQRPLALVTIETPNAGALAATVSSAGLDRLEIASLDRYHVQTAEPVPVTLPAHTDGTTSGVELLTLFRRKPGLDDATFIERWHGGHTPLSLEIHPLRGYIRNVVQARRPETAVPLDGIVEEHFACRRDLLNPTVFFGGALLMIPNMIRVAADIRRFIDLRTLETYWVAERWLRR